MICFPDVNVWVALIVAEHIHNRAAKAWYEQAEWEMLVFSRITQTGFLRMLANSHVMGKRVVSAQDAWAIVDDLCGNGSIRFALEPPGIEQAWRDLTPAAQSGSSFWTDAYLAAFARTSGYTLVTFDRGLARYGNTPVKLLSGA